MSMNGEAVQIWKEEVLAYFTVLSQHSPGITVDRLISDLARIHTDFHLNTNISKSVTATQIYIYIAWQFC